MSELEPRAFLSVLPLDFPLPTEMTTIPPNAPVLSAVAVASTGSGFFDGVNVHSEADPARVIPILRDLGARGVRLWGNIHWSSRRGQLAFQRAREYHAAGLHVTLLMTSPYAPRYVRAKTYFDWVQSLPGLRDAVDRWEIGNEPNLPQFFDGSLKTFVKNELRAAWDSLHPAGETVVGGGVNFDLEACRTLKRYGYLNYCDLAALHPYGTNPRQQRAIIAGAKRIFGDKPITLTEWNLHPESYDHRKWASMLNKIHPFVSRNVDSAFYFRLMVRETSPAGPGALITPWYRPHWPFYKTFKSWHDSAASEVLAPKAAA